MRREAISSPEMRATSTLIHPRKLRFRVSSIPDRCHLLFDPFRSGQREPGRGDGLGLGLYIVSQIVEAHQGTVAVKRGQGDETSFHVRLPRTAPR
jgi:two-component system, sensor histidine kinase and response regulator